MHKLFYFLLLGSVRAEQEPIIEFSRVQEGLSEVELPVLNALHLFHFNEHVIELESFDDCLFFNFYHAEVAFVLKTWPLAVKTLDLMDSLLGLYESGPGVKPRIRSNSLHGIAIIPLFFGHSC